MNGRVFLIRLGKKYPKRLTSWKDDRLGLSVCPIKKEVKTVMVTLDATMECVLDAIKHQAEVIVTHHPLLFPNKKIALQDDNILKIYELMQKHQIAHYCLHTNFDCAPLDGMNTIFGEMLDLTSIRQVENSFLFVGETKIDATVNDIIKLIKEKLQLDYVLYQGQDLTKPVKKLGFVLGSGVKEYYPALLNNVDLFISGESRHHQRLAMKAFHLNYIELPHEVEQTIFVPQMTKTIKSLDNNLRVISYFEQKPLLVK